MNYKLGSLFDGSGGFPLAGALCGIEPVWAAEVEPYPIAVTRSRFPNMKHLGDISKVSGAEIEPVDIITFGSPCQDLSVAGKRAGLKHTENGDEETTRSGLFMEAVRIIKEMRRATNGEYPRFALWENVPGAFSSNNGEDFRIVCEELIKIVEPGAFMPSVPKNGWNYADSFVGDGWSLAYRVLDAQYWGVPQRRRRIYLVTDFRGESAREVLFEREGLRGYFTQGRTPWQTTPAHAEGSLGADDQQGESHGGDGDRGLDAVDPTFIIDNIGGQAEYGKESPVNGTLRAGGQGAIAYCCVDKKVSIGLNGENQVSPTLIARMSSAVGTTQDGLILCEEVPQEVEARTDPNFIDVEMEVAVRKYEVNTALLCECLRDHKAASNFSNKEIAEQLNRPITEVEHWFRADKYFAIPDPSVWYALKELLGIETTEFDQSITEFEFKAGNYDMRNRIHTGDTSPTLTCGCGNDLHLLPSDPAECEPIPIHDQATRFSGKRGDKSDGKGNGLGVGAPGDPMNTLTNGDRHAVAYQEPTTVEGETVSGTLMARDYKGLGRWDTVSRIICTNYIVRRLTPTECARLQGFADRWGDIDPKNTMTAEEYEFWLEVRNTHARINGRPEKDYTVKQMLTWYNKLQTDSAEYKMWGNGIALPTALYCIQGIADALEKATTEAQEVIIEDDDDWMN